jgi:hypothetical protein
VKTTVNEGFETASNQPGAFAKLVIIDEPLGELQDRDAIEFVGIGGDQQRVRRHHDRSPAVAVLQLLLQVQPLRKQQLQAFEQRTRKAIQVGPQHPELRMREGEPSGTAGGGRIVERLSEAGPSGDAQAAPPTIEFVLATGAGPAAPECLAPV